MKTPQTLLLSTVFVAALSAQAGAQQKHFEIDNQKNKYRNVATIESVADFETFTGKTNEVSGSIYFDPATRKGSGKIVVDPSSTDTGIALRNEHMKSEGWLDTKKYPEIVFEAEKAQPLKGDEYRVTGKFTLHGVTRKITKNVRVRYHAADETTKKVGFEGDVVQLATKFTISLADYGIKLPPMVAGKVAKDVTISLSSYAVSKGNG
jgi:polyisoprenoid-binding protein YceI